MAKGVLAPNKMADSRASGIPIRLMALFYAAGVQSPQGSHANSDSNFPFPGVVARRATFVKIAPIAINQCFPNRVHARQRPIQPKRQVDTVCFTTIVSNRKIQTRV